MRAPGTTSSPGIGGIINQPAVLARFIDDVENRRKRIVVYSDEEDADVADGFATRNATGERRPLPPNGPDPSITLSDDETGFAGAIRAEDLETLLAPPIVRPGDPRDLSAG